MTSFRYVPSEESDSIAPLSKRHFGSLIAAFQTLDTNRQGFFPKDILLHILTTKGSRKLDPEFVEKVLNEVALGGRVYYKDICQLFKDTSIKAESVLNEKQTSEASKSVGLTDKEFVEPFDLPEELSDPLQESKQTIFSETSDSSPSLGQDFVSTPTQRPGSASGEQANIPTVMMPISETIDGSTDIEATSEIKDYDAIINANPDEASLDNDVGSQENIPEILLASTSHN